MHWLLRYVQEGRFAEMNEIWDWLVHSNAGVGFFAVLAGVDIMRNGRAATRWREYIFLLTAVVVAMIYGIANNQISATVSWEYFYYGKELQCVLDGHGQHFVDILALVMHAQGLAVVTLALADITGHINIGQEVHLDSDQPIALASLSDGETVLDLGSGAGFDCFLAANKVGDSGRVIGKADKSYTPKESPFGPIDVAATMFDHFGIPQNMQKVDNGGRPRYLLEGEAKIIL